MFLQIIVCRANRRTDVSLDVTYLLKSEEAVQLAYGTSVVLHRYSFVPEIVHGMALEIFLHQ
jgi:hypothetical protein